MKYIDLETIKFIFWELLTQEYIKIQPANNTTQLDGRPESSHALQPGDKLIGRHISTGQDGLQRVRTLLMSLEHSHFASTDEFLKHLLNSDAYQHGKRFRTLVDKVMLKATFTQMANDSHTPITMYTAINLFPKYKPTLFARMFNDHATANWQETLARHLRDDLLGTRPATQHSAQNWLARRAPQRAAYSLDQSEYQAVVGARKRQAAQERQAAHEGYLGFGG